MFFCLFFFFQAEDGIRDYKVTGVQTCALPISVRAMTASPQGDRTISPTRGTMKNAAPIAAGTTMTIGTRSRRMRSGGREEAERLKLGLARRGHNVANEYVGGSRIGSRLDGHDRVGRDDIVSV